MKEKYIEYLKLVMISELEYLFELG